MSPYRSVILLGFLVLLVLSGSNQPVQAHGPEPAKTPATEASDSQEVWGCPMCETVRQAIPGTCRLCRMDLVRMDLEAEPANDAALADPPAAGSRGSAPGGAAPLMPGVPVWLFCVAATSILVVSFLFLQVRNGTGSGQPVRGRRLDLFRVPGLKWLIRGKWFVPGAQLAVFGLFTLVILAGLFGNQDPGRNITPVITWTVWWTWLVLVILFLGKIWCTVCPWMALANLFSGRGLNRRWPRRLRNIWIATFLFVALTWFELGFGVTEKPWLTATLGLVMVLASIATVLVYERKAFCRYACLVGRVSGLYSMFAASELRSTDPGACRSCVTKDCYHGNARAQPCPTHQFIGAMETNTYCTLCFECVKACPTDNVSWNLRPPGADLTESTRTRVDEAYLAVILLSMSAFHGLSMTPVWEQLVSGIQGATGAGWLAAFSAGMAGLIALPLLLYYGICDVMRRLAGDREHSTRLLFIRFSYSLLPIALFYHLAHNLQHIFFEGKKLVRAASDPFGWDWNLFGTAGMAIDAMLPVHIGWGLQVLLIVVGHLFGILIAHQVASAMYADRRQATLSQIPMLLAMLLFSFQSLWLLAQPMVMRTAM